jgi:signal transduction histidine kinase
MTRRRPLLEISLRWREPAVLRGQVALMQRNFPISLLASIATALGTTWTLWNMVPTVALIAWLASHIVVISIIYFVVRKSEQDTSDPHSTAATLVTCMAVLGIIWGALAIVTMQYGQKEALLYVLAIMGGVCSGAMGLGAPLFPAYLAFLVSPAGMVALAFGLSGGPVSLPMMSLTLVYFTLTCIQARNAEEATYRSLLLQIENQGLVHRLQLESSQSQKALTRSEAAQLAAQQAQLQAEKANADKSKFLAAASHDLRQPLHAMGLFLEALTRSEMTAQQITVLDHAHAASNAASEMLTTLLDFSRLEAGVVQPQAKGFLLQPLISKLEQEFGVQADTSDLVYRTRETSLAAMADPNLTDLVVRNFISNAIRYTDKGGVLVACRKRGDCVVVEVWDTGIGIAADQQAEIFKEFHQLGNPERDRRKGLGLGLAIVERISAAMEARVSLHSRLGHGTVFRLWLPLFNGAVIHDDRISTASPQSLQGMRVLVIDDEEPVRLGMQELLDSWGCICHTAEELSVALKCVALLPMHEQPEVILADYRLREGATGGQAIAALRAYLALRGHVHAIPAIIITGDTAPERLREARSSNATVLHKPVSAAALQQALIQLR